MGTNHTARTGRKTHPHGGVLIIVKKSFISEEIPTQCPGECVFVKVDQTNNNPLIIGAVYRPTNGDFEYIKSICTTTADLSDKHKNATIWLGGDFNLPDICWKNHQVTGHQYPLRVNNKFLDTIQDLGMDQVVEFPTRKDSFLDLFLTNRPSLVNRTEPLPGLSDHDTIILINSDIIAKRQRPVKRKVHLWKKANQDDISSACRTFSEGFVNRHTVGSDVNTMWEEIKHGISTS